MFTNQFDKGSELRSDNPPELLNSLETAIWWLLGVQGNQRSATELYHKLVELS